MVENAPELDQRLALLHDLCLLYPSTVLDQRSRMLLELDQRLALLHDLCLLYPSTVLDQWSREPERS
jgi:hypothetical protein